MFNLAHKRAKRPASTAMFVVIGNQSTGGRTTICLRGCSTSPPPPCLTNSAGVKKLPWQTHTIFSSSHFVYLYKNPSIFLPFTPSPLVVTRGMSANILFKASYFDTFLLLGWDDVGFVGIGVDPQGIDVDIWCGMGFWVPALFSSMFLLVPVIWSTKFDSWFKARCNKNKKYQIMYPPV